MDREIEPVPLSDWQHYLGGRQAAEAQWAIRRKKALAKASSRQVSTEHGWEFIAGAIKNRFRFWLRR
jgi:hypothetical protein